MFFFISIPLQKLLRRRSLHLHRQRDHATGESSGYEIDGTRLTIEAAELNVLSGDITILSSDDCMNAANSDLGNYDFVINISGGTQPGARPGGNMGDMQPPSGEPGGQKPDGEPPAKPE